MLAPIVSCFNIMFNVVFSWVVEARETTYREFEDNRKLFNQSIFNKTIAHVSLYAVDGFVYKHVSRYAYVRPPLTHRVTVKTTKMGHKYMVTVQCKYQREPCGAFAFKT